MSSSRLPGKVLLPLKNIPALQHVYDRTSYSRLVTNTVVATSINSNDDPIENLCKSRNISIYRGDLTDVLDRFYNCAIEYKADVIVRITSDCPVIDPVVIDAVISGFLSGNYDYYALGGGFPDGLDCEVLSFSALEKAWKNATRLSDREHVCPYIHTTCRDQFKNGSLNLFSNLDEMRWTLDEPLDYVLLSKIYDSLYEPESIFFTSDILSLLSLHPTWKEINKSIPRNAGYLKSLENDFSVVMQNHS